MKVHNFRSNHWWLHALAVVSVLGLMGADDGNCFGSDDPVETVECIEVTDCEGLAHVQCVGNWQCLEGQCNFQCDDIKECTSDDDCGNNEKCDIQTGKCVVETVECVASGCSGEICATESMASDCVWLDWFECLSLTECNMQSDGACGFDQTSAFLECLAGLTPCTDDGDCPANFECINGECDPISSCTDADNDGACADQDCNDNDAAIFPGAVEVCNALDDDCDGDVDEGCSVTGCESDTDCAEGQYCDHSEFIDMVGCCVPLADGSGCPDNYPICPGICRPIEEKCEPIERNSHGDCEMVLGIIFDGTACVHESGCSCTPNCSAFFASMEECEKACLGEPECVDNDDCSEYETCIGGNCKLRQGLCWVDSDCYDDQYCDGAIVCPEGALCLVADSPGKCVSGLRDCFDSSECPDGQFCQYLYLDDENNGSTAPILIDQGFCEEIPEGSCLDSGDCADGQECIMPPCAGPIGCLGMCMDVEPQYCSSDYDCSVGQYCMFLINGDIPEDPTDLVGQCEDLLNGQCVRDADCGDNSMCIFDTPCASCIGCTCFGHCYAITTECSTDADCPDGLVCGNIRCGNGWCSGECIQPVETCTSDADCMEGETCIITVCPDCYGCECYGYCQSTPQECRIVESGSHGMCDMIIGVIFNGNECVWESGCGCEPDCDFVYDSMEACQYACFWNLPD